MGSTQASRAAALEHGLVRSLVTDQAFGPLRGLLLLLTVVTGVVDAISILALGRVFVANMTGNVVFAAFAVVGAPGFSLGASLFALAGFLVGAALSGPLIARAGRDRGALLRAGVLAEFLLAAAALLAAALSGEPGASHGTLVLTGRGTLAPFGPGLADGLAALLAIAMGIQNAVARKLAVPDLTTTVLTTTLTGLGADLRGVLRGAGPGGAGRKPARAALGRRLLAIAAMVAGAVAGALLTLHVSVLAGLAVAAGLLALAAAGAMAAASRPAPWRTPPAKS